ncbi:nuclear transport factor 2 family protein [Novosphingobium sp.]|uniref:nuclear transport factor 2 family protein n=1 Tax=Novosphingobium sp. TaxID=1874826 RepID=UPI0038B825FA
MSEVSAIEQLIAIEEIKALKARYFRLMDTKDFAGLRAVFADDATFDASCSLSLQSAEDAANWIHSGGDAIVAFVRAAVETLRTVHHGHCHEITVTSPTQAHGVIAMEDQIWDLAGTVKTLHGMGHYHETYVKVDGVWRIHTSRISRLHVIVG